MPTGYCVPPIAGSTGSPPLYSRAAEFSATEVALEPEGPEALLPVGTPGVALPPPPTAPAIASGLYLPRILPQK